MNSTGNVILWSVILVFFLLTCWAVIGGMLKKKKFTNLEYKRTCKMCGKIWYSLSSRENELIYTTRSIKPQEVIFNAETQLAVLKKCPDCGSSQYTEISKSDY